jgi:hypothetical protein
MTLKHIALLAFSLGMLVWSGEGRAQYNLRTVPVVPIADQPFAVVIDDSPCEDFLVDPPGLPPSFTVNGDVASLAVDRIEVINCGTDAITLSVSVPGLPAGNYTLEFVAKMFEVPEVSATLQSIPLSVIPAMAAAPASIPTVIVPVLVALALVVALLGLLGWQRSR